jgi:Leishmanolysin
VPSAPHKYKSYRARADRDRAKALAATDSPFTIEVRFLGGLTATQQAAFRTAADRWATVIVGDLPDVLVDGELVDDVLILAQGKAIDGVGKILGQAGPSRLRPSGIGAGSLLPAKGRMTFDSADLESMEQKGTLIDVITHEMGHVLGIGTIWQDSGLLEGAGTQNPLFTGEAAMEEYGQLRGSGPRPVPVENTGGPGTADGHWRESVFRNELMTGFVSTPGNPLSRMTVASLADLGYQVDLDAADSYELPDLFALAEAGELVSHVAPIDDGIMLPIIPLVLPKESLPR